MSSAQGVGTSRTWPAPARWVHVGSSANAYHGIVGHGRPTAHSPGCGYIDDMLAGTTARLATTGTRRIADGGSHRLRPLKIKIRKIKIYVLTS